jgi:serine/threonine-protein kinase HipA
VSTLRRIQVLVGDRPAGTIAETAGREIYFEYDLEWLRGGFALSPYFLPLTPGLKREDSLVFEGLFGIFDDSIPDGWGRLLMDRFFRSKRTPLDSMSPLDRLAYVGDFGVGAVRYHPIIPEIAAPDSSAMNLSLVAEQAERIVAGSPEEALPALYSGGGSTGGSRPKVFVAYDPSSGLMSSQTGSAGPGFEPWLVKFRSEQDGEDAGSVEEAYAQMARAAGVDMPATRIFATGAGRFFGVQRFDRGAGGRRIYTHTFGGIVHSDFRHPDRDYQEFLAVVLKLTRDARQVEQAFLRAAFNVLAHNRDDHVKNHAFLASPTGDWTLAPAYDLTHSTGVNGEHNMTVAGSGRPGAGDLLELASSSGITPSRAKDLIASVRASTKRWPEFAEAAGVSESSNRTVAHALAAASGA